MSISAKDASRRIRDEVYQATSFHCSHFQNCQYDNALNIKRGLYEKNKSQDIYLHFCNHVGKRWRVLFELLSNERQLVHVVPPHFCSWRTKFIIWLKTLGLLWLRCFILDYIRCVSLKRIYFTFNLKMLYTILLCKYYTMFICSEDWYKRKYSNVCHIFYSV